MIGAKDGVNNVSLDDVPDIDHCDQTISSLGSQRKREDSQFSPVKILDSSAKVKLRNVSSSQHNTGLGQGELGSHPDQINPRLSERRGIQLNSLENTQKMAVSQQSENR